MTNGKGAPAQGAPHTNIADAEVIGSPSGASTTDHTQALRQARDTSRLAELLLMQVAHLTRQVAKLSAELDGLRNDVVEDLDDRLSNVEFWKRDVDIDLDIWVPRVRILWAESL